MNVEQMIDENKDLDRRFASSFKAKDLEGVLSCYWKSPETVVYPADDVNGLKGYAAIAAGLKQMFDSAEKVLAFELAENNYVVLGDAVVGSGRYVMKVRPRGSPKEMEIVGRYTDVREKKDGKWVYVYDHESMVPMPIAGPPAAMNP